MTSSMKHRSSSENTRKVCLFYSQSNKSVWLSNMADILLRNSRGAQRYVGFFSWLYFPDADWLGRQAPITWWQSDVINGVGYKHSFIAFISHGVILINSNCNELDLHFSFQSDLPRHFTSPHQRARVTLASVKLLPRVLAVHDSVLSLLTAGLSFTTNQIKCA